MKLSDDQIRKAFAGKPGRKSDRKRAGFSTKEMVILKEILKQMPEDAIRHIDYAKIRKELKKVSPDEVTEKLLLRLIVDKHLQKN